MRPGEQALPSLCSKGDQGREGVYGKGRWSSESEPEPLYPRATHNDQSRNFRGNFAYTTFMPKFQCSCTCVPYVHPELSFQLEHAQERPVTFSRLHTERTSISATASSDGTPLPRHHFMPCCHFKGAPKVIPVGPSE